MKKQIGLLCVALMLVSLVSAQSEEYKSTITGGIGFTLSGALVKAAETSSLGSVNSKGIPNVELAYDYGVTNWFSIGAMAAFQKLTLEEDFTGGINKYSLTRVYVGSSFLFHYANSGRMDLFSGFRLGYKNWSYSSTLISGTQGIGFEDLSFFSGPFAYQVVLFGIRGFVTDNIGINFEVLSIGTPHLSSLGVSYRF